MIDIEINGIPIKARDGAMVIEAADEAGIPIPRFCYHKKLSVAANCRMCLVEVEKAAKPLPACSTPATEGMRVYTQSPKAIMAQKGVMEFLLINHPLDCPICDQGGECELQDVAMGYGRDVSRYQEKKRVVKDKDLGPLISTDMTRCIHCTRCVRFGIEIAGVMELGATGRGEHMEIGTYIEKSMVSEMSGNVIDLCPVGALTSKPFRYTARPWEMVSREAIAPHDSIGSHLHLHVRDKRVMRVVPREMEEINEVWLSDRDRYSYEGLNSAERLQAPLIKQNGVWQEVDWKTALDFTVQGLNKIIGTQGAAQIGALVSPSATLEELYLLQKLLRGVGCANIDHRLRQSDFSAQDDMPLYPSLGLAIEDVEYLDAALLIGSHVRKEQPIVAHRLRKAAMRGAAVMFINAVDYDIHFKVQEKLIVHPADTVAALAGVVKALMQRPGAAVIPGLSDWLQAIQPDATQQAMAQHLARARRAAVLLGNTAVMHPQFAVLERLVDALAQLSGARLGYLPEAANSAGAWLAGALPQRGPAGASVDHAGLHARAMLETPLQGYVLMGVEPEFDAAYPASAMKALKAAQFVVSLSAFGSQTMQDYADVLLPVAAFAETSGTFVNLEGRWQSFAGAVPPPGEARPAWKVLRVLGNLFNVPGFDYISSDQVRDELRQAVDDVTAAATAQTHAASIPAAPLPTPPRQGLTRITDVPPYALDGLVRRAPALQQTPDAGRAVLYVNEALAARLGLSDEAVVQQGNAQVILHVVVDAGIPDDCVRIPAGLSGTERLEPPFGPVEVRKL